MLKKWVGSFMTVAVVLFGLALPQASAAEASEYAGEFSQAANTFLQEEHPHFKNGSLELFDLTVIDVEDPEGNITTLVGAKVKYLTVRDEVFGFTHVNTMFFNPTENTIADKTVVGGFEPVSAFQEQYRDASGKFMHFTAILLYLLALVAVPIIILVIMKKRYSSMEFVTQNDVYKQSTTYL